MGRLRIARREVSSLRREKTIVLALIIQLFIAGFSSFLLVGLVSLYDPGSTGGAGVSIGVAGDAADELAVSVDRKGSWRVTTYADEAAARRAFDRGRIDAVLLTTRLRSGRVEVEALVPDESVRSTVVVVQVREVLQAYERERRRALSHRLTEEPVPVPDAPGSTPTFAFTYTVLLPLLSFLPVFISGSVAADTITEEVDAGTLDLLRATPVSAGGIVDGKMLAMIALAPAQAAAWLALLVANGTAIADPIAILGLVAAAAVFLVSLGAGLAVALGDRQSTQLIYSLAVLAVFGAASLLPQSPPNVIARLAIGSPTAATYAIVVVALVFSALSYAGIRVVAVRSIEG